ncbi:hypothetical protein MTO96_011711 [Rhipicephalus appendiculatus]
MFLSISGCSIVIENSHVAAQQSAHPNEDAKTVSVPIVNHNNRTYTVLLKIGTPAQEFNVAFDTAAYTWVPANTCPDGTLCVGRKAFKSNESSTHTVISHNRFSEFRSGNVAGDEIEDVQAIGDVEIGKLRFINASLSNYGAPNYTEEPFDGVFGLRLGPNSPLTHMARTGVIAKPWLGLYFSADNNVPGRSSVRWSQRAALPRYEYAGVNRIFATRESQSTAVLAPAEQFILGPYREIYSLNELLGGRFTNEGILLVSKRRPRKKRDSRHWIIRGATYKLQQSTVLLRPEHRLSVAIL